MSFLVEAMGESTKLTYEEFRLLHSASHLQFVRNGTVCKGDCLRVTSDISCHEDRVLIGNLLHEIYHGVSRMLILPGGIRPEL